MQKKSQTKTQIEIADTTNTTATNTRLPCGNFVVVDLGTMDYRQAWQWQRQRHKAVAAGATPQTLVLVEHPPVLTLGRNANMAHVLTPLDQLVAQGFTTHHIERGGDVTYHGPGQLVGYPIFRVGRHVRSFLRGLEAAIISVLSTYGIAAVGNDGYAGVWVDDGQFSDPCSETSNAPKDAKIAAIGIAIKKQVSLHGFAFNIAPDLSHFAHIVPCGIADKRVTSLQALLPSAQEVSVEDIKPKIVQAIAEVFDMQVTSTNGNG